MHTEKLKELLSQKFITEEQYNNIEPVISGKIISVFFELRTLLYLGVLLFSTGVGILIYENIGDIGHLISIIILFTLTLACFVYVFRRAPAYSHGKVSSHSPYYDYVVLLGCLLFISVLGYLQFQYELFDEGMGLTTLITAMFFFFVAYRLDNIAVLSLAITAFASFWSISVSPQKWYTGDFLSSENLYVTAMIFGSAMAAIALGVDRKGVKTHFTFTYLNFSILIFLIGTLTGIFENYNSYALYLLLLYGGCAFCVYYANIRKSFLFLLYAAIAAYVGTTYFLSDFVLKDPLLWFFYLIASCGGLITFIIRYKNYFKRAE